MKVLVIAPPLGSAGGIQRYNLCLLRALKEILGDQNVLCVSITESPNGMKRSNLSNVTKLNFALNAVRDSHRWKPDLILCTHIALGPIGWMAAKIAGCPYWVFAYGIEAWVRLAKAKRSALVRASRVVVISEFSREQITKRHQVESPRIGTLPCALDDTLLQITPTKDGAYSRIPENQPVVMTVARMAASERYKGHDVILQSLTSVIAQIPDLVYVVVGDGDDRPNLERLATKLGIGNHVVFTGEVDDAELVGLYQRCDVFALPARTEIDDDESKGEGFGIVYLEAMAFGIPVIGPNYGAPVEFIRHGESGLLVDPRDSLSVGKAILKLLTEKDSARKMGTTGRNWVRQNYSYDSFRERLNKMLLPIAASIHVD